MLWRRTFGRDFRLEFRHFVRANPEGCQKVAGASFPAKAGNDHRKGVLRFAAPWMGARPNIAFVLRSRRDLAAVRFVRRP